MPSTWLGSEFLRHWFDLTRVRTDAVRISRSFKTGDRHSTHLAIPILIMPRAWQGSDHFQCLSHCFDSTRRYRLPSLPKWERHSAIPSGLFRHTLLIPSARLGSDKYQFTHGTALTRLVFKLTTFCPGSMRSNNWATASGHYTITERSAPAQ